MAVEHWENADEFDVIRDKTNDAFDEIGKVKREDGFDLADIKDVLIGENGVSIDNTDLGGLMKFAINGLAENTGRYPRSSGTGFDWPSFDIQNSSNDLGGALFPPSSSGAALLSPLTVPSYGHNLSYIYIATIDLDYSSTSPVHRISVRLNGSIIKSRDISMDEIDKKTITITGAYGGVSPGSTFDVFTQVVGSGNQYNYYNVELVLLGIPS